MNDRRVIAMIVGLSLGLLLLWRVVRVNEPHPLLGVWSGPHFGYPTGDGCPFVAGTPIRLMFDSEHFYIDLADSDVICGGTYEDHEEEDQPSLVLDLTRRGASMPTVVRYRYHLIDSTLTLISEDGATFVYHRIDDSIPESYRKAHQ